jgi:hypothetical protein
MFCLKILSLSGRLSMINSYGNLVLALIAKSDFPFVPSAQRFRRSPFRAFVFLILEYPASSPNCFRASAFCV